MAYNPTSLDNLKRGNNGVPGGWEGAGRKPNAVKKSRREWEAQLSDDCGELANKVIKDKLAEGCVHTARWVQEAIHGQAKATIRTEIGSPEVIAAVGLVLANYFGSDQIDKIISEIQAQLGIDSGE